MNWIEALLLGVVQGLTEFLPVSSDGHLTVTAKICSWFTGVERKEKDNIFFFVMLHLGTTLAILVHYRKEILAGMKGVFGSLHVPELYQRNALVRVAVLVAVSTSWLVLDKLFFMKYMEQAYGSSTAIGIGFWITAGALAVTVSRLTGGDKGPVETTYFDALLIGLAQAFAPLPGVSRSGLTVAIALALGFRRTWAVQYSLMLAVPAIMGAAVFEIEDVDRSKLTPELISQTLAATVVAGIVGYLAIVLLLKAVRSGILWYFSVYLVALGLIVMLWLPSAKEPSDAASPPPARRTSRTESPRSIDPRVPAIGQRAVDRPYDALSETG